MMGNVRCGRTYAQKEVNDLKPKKSMAMRIIVLVIAIAMMAGFFMLPLLQNQ